MNPGRFRVRLPAVMRWDVLREALRRARLLTGLGHAPFARKAHLDRATVDRTENQRKYPDYRPTLDILTAWCAAAGVDLPDLLRRCEELPLTPPVTVPQDSASPSQETHGGSHVAAGVPASLASVVDELRVVVRELRALSLTVTERAVAFERAPIDERAATARVIAPRTRPVRRKRDRKTAR